MKNTNAELGERDKAVIF